MNKPQIAKTVVKYATGFAIAQSVRSVIRANVPPSENRAVNLLVDASIYVTSFAVTGMAHEAVSEYTDRKIDEFTATIRSFSN